MNRIVVYSVVGVLLLGIGSIPTVFRWMQDAEYEKTLAPYRELQAKHERELAETLGHGVNLGVTLAAYSTVKDGMPAWEVQRTIGPTGVEKSRAGTMVTRYWRDGDKIITVVFVNERVVGKSQDGF